MPYRKRQPLEAFAQWKNPLGTYLVRKHMNNEEFCRQLGVRGKTLRNWLYGHLPSLPFLYEIQRVTDNQVCIEDWVSHPQAVEVILDLRRRRAAKVAPNANLP